MQYEDNFTFSYSNSCCCFSFIYLGFAGLDNCPVYGIPTFLITIGAISLALVAVLFLQVLILLGKLECTQNEWWLSLLYYMLLVAIISWANIGEFTFNLSFIFFFSIKCNLYERILMFVTYPVKTCISRQR